MTPEAEVVLNELLEGNARFRSGRSNNYQYFPQDLADIALSQHPKAAIIACSDSRVSPDVILDQPLGYIFASRVPGNVASDSAKWMLEISVGEFEVPLVVVMGHTGCLAVGQLLDGDKGGAGGLHRFAVLSAVYKAKKKRPENLYAQSIEENVLQTMEHLVRDLYSLRRAIIAGNTVIIGAVYDMPTGEVKVLESKLDLYGAF